MYNNIIKSICAKADVPVESARPPRSASRDPFSHGEASDFGHGPAAFFGCGQTTRRLVEWSKQTKKHQKTEIFLAEKSNFCWDPWLKVPQVLKCSLKWAAKNRYEQFAKTNTNKFQNIISGCKRVI